MWIQREGRAGGDSAGTNDDGSGVGLRIMFLSCLYPPEREPSALMAAQLARSLKEHGHAVTVVAPFPNRPKGIAYAGYQRRLRRIENLDGVRVVRCPTWFLGPDRHVAGRAFENLSFGAVGAFYAALERRPDVLLMETWPLAATQIGLWMARILRIPVLYYIKDLYPDVLEDSGILQSHGRLARSLLAWDRRLCLASSRVIAISAGMKKRIVGTRGISPDHVVVIRDWIDEDEFRPLPRDNEWRREMGLQPESFVVLYAGTLGIVSGADVLVETAEALKGCTDALLLCVGEGVLKDRMAAAARLRSLMNIRLEPFQDRKRVPEMHAAADVCVLTMKPGLSNASVPSKLITYMAAGRPVICAAPSDTDVAREVLRANAGRVVPPGDPAALALAIRELQSKPDLVREMGANARRHFESELAFRHRYEEFISVIRQAVARRSPESTLVQPDGSRARPIVSAKGGAQ